MYALAYHYLKTMFRQMRRQGIYSLINLSGLTVGIVAFTLIYIYLQQEYSYDRCWDEHQNIYRLNQSLSFGDRMDHFALSSYNMGQAMKHDYPEIEAATMIYHSSYSAEGPGVTVWHGDNKLQIPSYSVADEDFFRVFDYPFLEGDPSTALAEPHSLVITDQVAEVFFGSSQALGEMLRINRKTFTITGVVDTEHCLSHLQFDALMSFSTLPATTLEQMRKDWFWLIGYTYLKFRDETGRHGFEDKLEQMLEERVRPWISSLNIDGNIQLDIEAISGIHFNTRLQYDSNSNTNKRFVNMFAIIAAFLLLIASINYMNLATARSMKRAREIGIRKVAGAHRSQLMLQFLAESLLYTIIASILALMLTELLLPYFSGLIGMELSLLSILWGQNGGPLLLLLLIILLLALLSGSFPAFVLSSFKPVRVLRPGMQIVHHNGFSSSHLRKGLVVLQFVISISLIISTLVVSKQLSYMRTHDPGINLDQIMTIHYPADSALRANREVIKQQMLSIPEVSHASVNQNLPGYKSGRMMFFMGDTAGPEVLTMNLYMVDHDFFDLLDVQLLEGRLFSKAHTNDPTTAFVVNRAAAQLMCYENPVGVDMKCGMGVDGKVIGMVENFNYSSLHSPIEPLVFLLNQNRISFLAVRFHSPEPLHAINRITEVWQAFDRNHYMQYSFLDQQFGKQYLREENMLSLFGYFSLLIIIISCLGLFGLSAYTVEQRRKEIGIRKVLGSSGYEIISLLIREFLLLVFIAGLIALPVTWYLMWDWLTGFAYAVRMSPLWFAFGLLIALVIAMFTVLSQAMKAVYANPVQAIQYE